MAKHNPNDISPESYKKDPNYWVTKGGSIFADPKRVLRKEAKRKAIAKRMKGVSEEKHVYPRSRQFKGWPRGAG